MQDFSSIISPYLRTFKRKAFLVASFTTLTTALALWFSLKDPNTYVSSFRILLEPTNSTAKLSQASTLARTEGLPDKDLLNLDYPTQLEILKSPLMLSKIVDRVKVKLPGIDSLAISESLRKNLIVERITIGPSRYDWTKIVEITYQEIDPYIVRAVAESTAEQYLKYSLEERQNSINSGVSFIDEQLPQLEQRVASLQAQQQNLQQKYHLIDPDIKGQELFTQVDDLKRKKLANENELLELRTLSQTLQEQLNLTPTQAVVSLALNQNPNHRELLRQLQKIESAIAGESARFTPNSPQVLALKEDKANLLELLQTKIEPILKQHSISFTKDPAIFTYQNESFLELTQQLVNTHNQIEVLQVRDRSIQTTKHTLAQPAHQLPAIARQYDEIERELALTNSILERLLTQKETLRVEAAQKDIPWKLLGKAEVIRDEEGQAKAFPPNRTRKLFAGIAIGMFLGMGTALLIEKWQNLFYCAEDIQDLFLLPLLGTIPKGDLPQSLPNTDVNCSSLAVVETQNSDRESLFFKAFDSLYAELTFLYADNPTNSLLMTSVEPQDGQSTVALELAKIAAKEGKRVLLVDANLDCPQLNSSLHLPPSRNTNSQFHNRSVATEVIYRVPGIENLYMLTAEALQAEYSTKLWSTKMQEAIADFSTDYDLVIYDAPHFLDSPDVSFLASLTDGIILVVGIKKTHKSLVQEAIEQINSFRLPILGIVGNYS